MKNTDDEERWVSIGQAQNGQYLVVVHTSEWLDDDHIKVRIILARKAERNEIRDYEDTPPQR